MSRWNLRLQGMPARALSVFLVTGLVAELGACATPAGPAAGPLPALVESALAQAQTLTGLGRQQLRVLDAAAVSWPDGAGGCPEPDRIYTQAIVPGFRIRIQAGTQVLNYHATRGSATPVLCPAHRVQPALPATPGSGSDKS